jgi:hypothetical protein
VLISNILLLALAILVLLAGSYFLIYSTKKKTKFGINLTEVACPECSAIQPKIRKPNNLRQTLCGGGTCICGCEMDKYGNNINT